MTTQMLTWLGRLLGWEHDLLARLLTNEERDAQERRLVELEAAMRTLDDWAEFYENRHDPNVDVHKR